MTYGMVRPLSHGQTGQTADLVLCAPVGHAARCVIASRSGANVYSSRLLTGTPRSSLGHLLPMGRALAGQTGVVSAWDYLHKKVVAAYAPVGQLGLGMVLMVNRAALNGPVTDQLWVIGPLLAVLVLAGVLLLRGMITPLVRELAPSQHEARVDTTTLQSPEHSGSSQAVRESRDDDLEAFPQRHMPRWMLNTAGWVVAAVGAIILVCELLIMIAISVLEPRFHGVGTIFWIFIDPIVLTILVSPTLYILIFRPMRNQQIALEGQLAILRHNKQLDALVEAIPDAVFLKDGAGRWLVINEPAKQLFRLSKVSWQGKTDKELADIQPALRPAHEGCLASDEAAWQYGRLLVSEESLTGSDGQSVILETRKMPMFDKEGRRRGLAIIGRDVTERHRVEQERHIAAIAFETSEGIVITDPDARILRVNRAFARMAGYSVEDMVGRTPAILHSGRQDAAFYRDLWETLIRDRYWQGEIWNRRKDGTMYLEWLTITAVTDTQGQVTHYVGVCSDITLRKQAEEEIHKLAFYDPLTKLPNRSLFSDRLQQARAYSARHKTYGALFFIDLDNFKTLNDTEGHDIGDLLLIEVAERLRKGVRPNDTAARLGGDEFVVLLVALSENVSQAIIQVQGVGQKILAALNQPYYIQGREYYSSASIGICPFNGSEDSLGDILRHADAAMYQAKAAGRNVLRFFDPAMQAVLESRVALESDLRQALSRRQLKIFYQAQIDERQGITGAEALLRWDHPKHGLIPSSDFIRLAEDTGLIVPIGQWVLQEVCAQLKVWETDPRMRSLGISVNVSARQFRKSDFIDQVLDTVTTAGVDPKKITFEITEAFVIDNVNDSIDKMGTLHGIGIRLSLDDFGTGQSSLSHLRRLPLDQIKIDQSFIGAISTDINDNVIVKTIIGMANNLGLEIIAEGVATEQQWEFLRSNGCHRYQGHLFAKPMPIAEFETKVGASFGAKSDRTPPPTV